MGNNANGSIISKHVRTLSMGLPCKYQVVRPLKSNQLLDEYDKGPDGPFALVAQRKQVVTNEKVNEQN